MHRASLALLVLPAAVACTTIHTVPPAPCTGLPATITTAPSLAPPAPPDAAAALEELNAYALTRGFRLGAPSHVTLTPDGKAALFLRSPPRDPKQSLFETSLVTGETRELLRPDALDRAPENLSQAERARRERLRIRTTGFTSFELSTDGKRVLLTLSGRLFVYRRADGASRELRIGVPGKDGGAIDPHFSPDGTRVAYVRGSDVYAVDVEGGREVEVTRGGTSQLTHGVAEFIAQEELDRSRGFWWSPDGAHLAYEEADTSRVDKLRISDPAHPETAPEETAYPRAGTANATLRFGIAAATGGKTTWVTFDREKYPYVATVQWRKGSPLTLYALDRLQKNATLLAVDPATGKTTTLLEEHDDAWLNVDPSMPRWLSDGTFLWSTERGGATSVELRSAKGLVRSLADATLGYRELVGVNEGKRVAYVDASPEPSECGIAALPLDGGRAKVISAAPLGVVAAAPVDHDVTALVVRRASLSAAPTYAVEPVGGGARTSLPSAAEAPRQLAKVERVTVGPDQMRVAIVRPRSFDPTRRYPVLDAAYGGPHVAVVTANAESYVLAQWLADQVDAIVVAIDAPGTPHRGRLWERAIAGHLGDVPVEGHVAAITALGARYPEMDVSRTGVYGWSFGGYFAARAVLARPEVYKAAVAAAPPADWRDYDTAYTERYLGLPADAGAVYDQASLLPLARAEGAPGTARPLLIVHGTADDNVYLLNSLKLVDALEHGHRPFELFLVSGMTHVPRDPTRVEEIWSRAAAFLRASLAAH